MTDLDLAAVKQQSCREWLDADVNYCRATAEFILWGKLFRQEALGPRCRDHAEQHLGWHGMSRVDQYAVYDLRPVERLERENRQLREAVAGVRALAEQWRDAPRSGFYPEAGAYDNARENCGDAIIDELEGVYIAGSSRTDRDKR